MKKIFVQEPATHLTIRQVAGKLNIHSETVRRWLRESRLHGMKTGSHWRIPVAELSRVEREGAI